MRRERNLLTGPGKGHGTQQAGTPLQAGKGPHQTRGLRNLPAPGRLGFRPWVLLRQHSWAVPRCAYQSRDGPWWGFLGLACVTKEVMDILVHIFCGCVFLSLGKIPASDPA